MATIASSNFTTLAYRTETTYGTLPAAAFKYVNFTGESLQFTKESITSNNINPSRQVSDLIQTGFQVSGGLNIEVAAKTFDEFIAGAMWNNWGTATDEDITAAFADDGTTKTITASTGTPFANIVAGQFVKVSNTAGGTAAAAANLGIFQVASRTDTVLTLDSNYSLTAESGKNVTVVGSMIKNPKDGLTSIRKSFYFEKSMEDLNPIYHIDYSGCMVNSMTVSAQASSILTGSIDFLGKTSNIYNNVLFIPASGTAVFASSGKTITLNTGGSFETAGVVPGDSLVVTGTTNNNGTFTVATGGVSAGVVTVEEVLVDETVADATNVTFTANHSKSTGSKTAVVGNNIMNSVSHVGTIRMGSTIDVGGANVNVMAGAGIYFQSLDFTINNNLRGVQAIGQMGNVSVSPGQLSVSGNMNAYFQDDTMYEKFVDGTEFSLSYEVIDENGDGYVFYFPRVAVGSSTMSAGGNDQDLVENMTWSALYSSTFETSVMINRLYSDYTDVPDA
jgi:hypothetical protein